jgi:rod shape-determining protein MreC
MNSSSNRTFQSIIIIIIAISLIILALGGYLSPLARVVLNPFISAQTWLSTRFQAIQTLINTPADVTALRLRNLELEAENARLQVQIIELQEQVAETEVLSTLVDYARSRPENRYVAAAVIGRDYSPFFQYLIINKGSDQGLRRGMPVVTEQGLVGQIAAVSSVASRVQLINDAGSSVNVIIQPSEAEAVLVGDVTGEVTLEMIPQNANIQPGDLIITSGLGGNYPQNLVIGQVNSIRSRDFDLFQSTSVQPAVNYRQLEIVLIIINFQPVDFTPLVPTPSTP